MNLFLESWGKKRLSPQKVKVPVRPSGQGSVIGLSRLAIFISFCWSQEVTPPKLQLKSFLRRAVEVI
jgi:hypothetical protein